MRRIRRRAARGVAGRIRLGRAGASPRLRRWVLAVVLLGVALIPYPLAAAYNGTPATACRSGCRQISALIRWTRALPGTWAVLPGLTGTVPASGLAYVSVGDGLAVVGAGLTVYGYSAQTGAPLWTQTLTGFPAGAAIVSVRTWPGEVTAGVTYTRAGHSERTEVVISGLDGTVTRSYPAAIFGGAVAGSAQYTVIVGATAVTSYDNATGKVRWSRSTGPVAQAWRTAGSTLYMAESEGGFEGSDPVTALRKINLVTGVQVVVQPLLGLSFPGTLSAAFGAVVLFSSAQGTAAYDGTSGVRLWSIAGAVAEGSDPQKDRIYLTVGSNLMAVNPRTGRVTATASGSAVYGSAGIYVVRDGVALGLDQGASGDAWGYNISAQRVTLAAPGLPWPHYFVDLSGIGGSADPASNLVVIAACTQLAPASPPSPTATPTTPTGTASTTPADTATPSATATPADTASASAGTRSSAAATSSASPSTSASASITPSPSPTPSAAAPAPQGCQRPELVALSL
jgi:PQQ-like domain